MEADRIGRGKVKLAFDTSFLMLLAEGGVSGIDEIIDTIGLYEPVVLGQTIAELERISKSKGVKRSRLARLALELVKGFRIVDYGSYRDADEALLGYAKASGAFVATSDEGLARRLKREGVRVVRVRAGRPYLE